jgi:hypothetical protein
VLDVDFNMGRMGGTNFEGFRDFSRGRPLLKQNTSRKIYNTMFVRGFGAMPPKGEVPFGR